MILIKSAQTNSLVVTVSQNSELPNPQYLFSFTHIFSKKQVNFIPFNVSQHSSRYDEFVFTESSSVNTTFGFTGLWTYKIYEQIAQNPPNLNPALAYNVVEYGQAQIVEGCAMTPDDFFVSYISPNEDNSNYIFVGEYDNPVSPCVNPGLTPTPSTPIQVTPTPTATIGTTPTPTPTIGTNCAIFLCQASPQYVYIYNPQTNVANYVFTYSGCATLDMALTDTQLFYYDGCQILWTLDYTYNNGTFTQTFNNSYNPLPGKAWGSGLTAKDNNTLISSTGYTLSNTVDDYTTIFEYDLTTSGYTALFQLPFHMAVLGDIVYSPTSQQLVMAIGNPFNSSNNQIVCYDLSGNVQNVVYTPDILWYGLYYDNTTGYIVAVNPNGLRYNVNWVAGRIDPLPMIKLDYLWGAGQKWSCQTFTVPIA